MPLIIFKCIQVLPKLAEKQKKNGKENPRHLP